MLYQKLYNQLKINLATFFVIFIFTSGIILCPFVVWFRQSPIQHSSMDKIRSSLLYDEGTQCEAEADEGMMQQGDNQKLAGSSTD